MFNPRSIIITTTISFNGAQYKTLLLASLAGEGHIELIETSNIVDEYAPTNEEELLVFRSKPLLCFCREGKYHLFSGTFNPKADKVRATIITKFTLKKCKVEVAVKPLPVFNGINLNPRYSQRENRPEQFYQNNQFPTR